MILSRVIPKWDFGIYALIIVIVNQFISFSCFGLDTTLVKLLSSEKKGDKKNIFPKVIILNTSSLLFFSILYLVTYQLFLPFFDEEIIPLSLYIIALFFLGNYRDLFYKICQGLNLFKKYIIIQVTSSMLRLSLIIIFYFFGIMELRNLLLIEILVSVGAIITQLVMIPWGTIIIRNVSSIETREIMNFALPIYFNNLFSSIYRRFNIFIIAGLLGPVSVAFYDIGNKIPTALNRMFDSFIIVFFPNLSTLFSEDKRKSAEELINRSLISFSIVLSMSALISFLFRTEIIILLFSEKYIDSSLVFSALMFNLMLRAFVNLLGYSNLAAGFPKVPMKVNIVTSILSISGSLLMIPYFGFIGVAYSLLFMNSVAQMFYIFYLSRVKIKINIMEYLRSVLILLATVLVVYILGDELIPVKILGIFLFVLFNWLLVPDFKKLVYSSVKFIPGFK